MGGDTDDRRKTERVPVNREFAGGADTYVSDLSEHGVFLQTAERVPIGTNLELRFTVLLDDPVTIVALGTVMRVQEDPPGLGIKFGPLSPGMVLRINDAVSRMRPRDSGPPVGEVRPGAAPSTRAAAKQAADEAFQDAKTGRFMPVRAAAALTDDEDTREFARRKKGPGSSMEDEKTLFRLKAIDMEIVEDEDELD